jgi:hypothetical protein
MVHLLLQRTKHINCKNNHLLKTSEEIPVNSKFSSGSGLLTVKNYSVNIEMKNILSSYQQFNITTLQG